VRAGTVGGLNYNNLGWNMRARRLVIGAEGSLPGGFGYNVEFNFAQGSVDYEDIILTYQRPKSPLRVTIGNFYPLSSLETMTSSRLTSFLERASFTDAFNYNRRLGVALALLDPASDRYTLTAGLFSQEINNTSFNRTGWQASVRGTFSPTVGGAKLHLGANFQHRVAQRDARNVQYRSRPFTQVTDQRFVDTGAIAADGDDIAGLEFGAIVKSFHAAAEAQQVWVRGYRPGKLFGPNDGAAGAAFYAGNPDFRSAYAEIGYYLTGETRGYKGGRWDRTKVLHPFDQGGWGAVQLNARLDWLDLRDRVGGASLAAPDYVSGGQQLGYELSLIWNPIDYIRFQAQYAHGSYKGGPRATAAAPASADPANRRGFDQDGFAVRAQVDF
jgi:phosphate-selective porin OprO/OprP